MFGSPSVPTPPPPPTPPVLGSPFTRSAGDLTQQRALGAFSNTLMTSTAGDTSRPRTARKTLIGD